MSLAMVVVTGVTGCGSDRPAPPGASTSQSSGQASAPSSDASSPVASASAAPSASTALRTDDAPPRRFHGSFKAHKRKVAPQSTAEDDAWKRDDGKVASGPGEIDLELGARGVTGMVKGPWGDLEIHGESTDTGFTASLSPSASSSPGAHGVFGGVVTGKSEKDGFDVELRVSSGDAVLVRDGTGHVDPVR